MNPSIWISFDVVFLQIDIATDPRLIQICQVFGTDKKFADLLKENDSDSYFAQIVKLLKTVQVNSLPGFLSKNLTAFCFSEFSLEICKYNIWTQLSAHG